MKLKGYRDIITRQDKIIIPIILLTISVFRLPSDSVRISFQLFAECGTAIVLAYLLWGMNKWIAMFSILACSSSFFPQYDRASFLAAHAVFYGMIWYYAVYERGYTESILNILCVVAIINVFFLILQFFGIDSIFGLVSGKTDILLGLMGNKNETAAVLALCFPAFLRKKVWMLIPIVLLGLVMVGSLGGLLAVIIGGGYYLLQKVDTMFDKIFLIILSIYIAIAALLIGHPDISYRLQTWIIGIKLFIKHPIAGSGIGHWKYVFDGISVGGRLDRMHQAHNEYLQGLFEMGIVFFFILCGFLVSLRNRLKVLPDIFKVATIIIIINCFVNFPLHIAVTAYMILVWLALIDKEYCKINLQNRVI